MDEDVQEERKLDEAMPWVGAYIAVASAVCTLAMAADAVNGFRRRKLWFPCTYFSLNSTSLTLLGIAMKLTMDLTAVMKYNRIAKVTTLIFMSTVIGNFMSSLGSMDDKHILSNVVALAILVLTVLVDVVIRFTVLTLVKVYIAPMILMLLSLATLVSLAITVPATKRSLECIYRENHRVALREEVRLSRKEALRIDERKRYMLKYWVMAATSNPQFVMARSVVCSTSALLCLIALISISIAYVLIWNKHEGSSVYKASMEWIIYTQTVGVGVGTVAPFLRWFVVVKFKQSNLDMKKLGDEFKIEDYWIQILVNERESFSSLQIGRGECRKFLHDAKWFVLTFCIWIQVLIVLLSKMFVFISALLMTPFFFFWKKLQFSNEANCDKGLNLSLYVLLLEGEAELPRTVVENICSEAENMIQIGRKKQPKSLMDVLSKSVDFKGVGLFDSYQISSLNSQEPPNSWALPVVTLTAIAVTVPHIEEDRRKKLLKSVSEGLSLAKLVEKTLIKDDRRHNVREAADTCWVGVSLYMKWLDFDLNRISLDCGDSKEMVRELSRRGEAIVVEYLKNSTIEDPRDWPCRVIAANSMYRISRSVALFAEEGDGGMFEKLCVMIADVMAACLTNLPNVVTTMCQGCEAIEKREKRVRKAFVLLGETERIVEALEKLQWPPMDIDDAAEIEEWRAWFLQNENGGPTLASVSTDERVAVRCTGEEEHLVMQIDV